jgi:hypothetical protein
MLQHHLLITHYDIQQTQKESLAAAQFIQTETFTVLDSSISHSPQSTHAQADTAPLVQLSVTLQHSA